MGMQGAYLGREGFVMVQVTFPRHTIVTIRGSQQQSYQVPTGYWLPHPGPRSHSLFLATKLHISVEEVSDIGGQHININAMFITIKLYLCPDKSGHDLRAGWPGQVSSDFLWKFQHNYPMRVRWISKQTLVTLSNSGGCGAYAGQGVFGSRSLCKEARAETLAAEDWNTRASEREGLLGRDGGELGDSLTFSLQDV